MAAVSEIRLWAASNDYVTLSYAWATVRHSLPGERITDRLGLMHRIVPAVDSYPVGLTIGMLSAELLETNNAGAPVSRTVLEWLEYYFRKQAELVVYLRGETLDVGGTALNRLLAYKGHIDELPGQYFGTLPEIGNPGESVELPLVISEDGTFSDFASLGSYSVYSPARP